MSIKVKNDGKPVCITNKINFCNIAREVRLAGATMSKRYKNYNYNYNYFTGLYLLDTILYTLLEEVP